MSFTHKNPSSGLRSNIGTAVDFSSAQSYSTCEISGIFLATKDRSSSLKMALQLRPAKLSDIPTITQLHSEAFQQSSPIDRIMHPRGLTPNVKRSSCAHHERVFNRKNTQYLVVTDSQSTGKDEPDAPVIAYARWYIHRETPPPKEAEAGPDKEIDVEEHEDVNNEFMKRFLGGAMEMKRQHMGDRACLCK